VRCFGMLPLAYEFRRLILLLNSYLYKNIEYLPSSLINFSVSKSKFMFFFNIDLKILFTFSLRKIFLFFGPLEGERVGDLVIPSIYIL
jgi:hypothetical protein